jgi:hypothetical protein
MKLIIMNRAKATPAIYASYSSAEDAVTHIMEGMRVVRECRIVSMSALSEYVRCVFGDDFYTSYEPFSGEWYVHERAPYDTAACDWCSIGGRFCECCNKYGEDPYENCGTIIDWELFLEWVDEGGTIFDWESFLEWVDEGGRAEQ